MCGKLLCCPKIVPPVSQEKVVDTKILYRLGVCHHTQKRGVCSLLSAYVYCIVITPSPSRVYEVRAEPYALPWSLWGLGTTFPSPLLNTPKCSRHHVTLWLWLSLKPFLESAV